MARCLGDPSETPQASAENWDWLVHLWASPRSLSTSLMYSFAQRPDAQVVDEPLYAHWLRESGAQHPMREQVLASQSQDGRQVADDVIFAPREAGKLRFVKHMAKHCTAGIRSHLLSRGRHVVLVREPLQILGSFNDVTPVTLEETGLPDALAIYSALTSYSGARGVKTTGGDSGSSGKDYPQGSPRVVVVDGRDLSCNPEGTLRALCRALRIPFLPEMLRWQPGGRPEDGVWAQAWYKEIHSSSGFKNSSGPYSSLMSHSGRELVVDNPSLYSLLEDCQPFYQLLKSKALRPLPSTEEGRSKPLSSLPGLSHVHPEPLLPVPANKRLLVWVGDGLVPRGEAKVHAFDSIVQGGDGTWEGLRIYQGKVFKLQEHLDRLVDSAKALKFERIPTQDEIKIALASTLAANGMRDNAHVRLTLTRGLKVTSGMSPHFNQYGCTLIVLAEWKPPVYDNEKGINLVTASTRRNPPQCLDSKIHHNNLLNNILAKIEGNNAGAEDAVMLDVNGFVSETNATNMFIVKDGTLLTPSTEHSALPGITRATVLEIARAEGIPTRECSITLSQLHSADEIFTTGTMGELTPCVCIDGRQVGSGGVGPMTRRLQSVYKKATEEGGWPLPEFVASNVKL